MFKWWQRRQRIKELDQYTAPLCIMKMPGEVSLILDHLNLTDKERILYNKHIYKFCSYWIRGKIITGLKQCIMISPPKGINKLRWQILTRSIINLTRDHIKFYINEEK